MREKYSHRPGAQLDFEREPGSMDFSDSWRIRTSLELCGENGGKLLRSNRASGPCKYRISNKHSRLLHRPTNRPLPPSLPAAQMTREEAKSDAGSIHKWVGSSVSLTSSRRSDYTADFARYVLQAITANCHVEPRGRRGSRAGESPHGLHAQI